MSCENNSPKNAPLCEKKPSISLVNKSPCESSVINQNQQTAQDSLKLDEPIEFDESDDTEESEESEEVNQQPDLGISSQVTLFKVARLNDNLECIRWCMKEGLLCSMMECHIHLTMRSLIRTDSTFPTWHCSRCDDEKRITFKSVFMEADLPITKLICIMWSFACGEDYQHANAVGVFKPGDSPFSPSTIKYWYKRFSQALVATSLQYELGDMGEPIGGKDKIVIIEHTVIGRLKYNQGRDLEGYWLVGGIDKESGKVKLAVYNKRDKFFLHNFIRNYVVEGSIIQNDGWSAFKGIEAYGFTLQDVNYCEETFADDESDTRIIEDNSRALDRWLSTGGRRKDEIADFLMVYAWRRSCKRNKSEPFSDLVRNFYAKFTLA